MKTVIIDQPGQPSRPVAARSVSQRGFTLVELIVAMTIASIIAMSLALFIRGQVQGYLASVARAELTDAADLALRRMSRDVRLALPNSIRVSADGKYLELLLTKTGGRYLSEDEERGDAGALSFTNPGALTFDVIGPMPSGRQAIVKDDSIIVYNLGPLNSPADAYSCDVPCNRATVAAAPNGNTVTMTNNPFAAQVPTMASPTMRFQVVSTPVSYFCDSAAGGNGGLKRYDNYPIASVQPVAFSASPALVVGNLTSCKFSYDSLANTHSALVGLTLTLEVPTSDSGEVVLYQQVHVDNTP